MKRALTVLFVPLLLVATAYFSLTLDSQTRGDSALQVQGTDPEPGKGPQAAIWYFAQWHYPYGNMLSADMMSSIWSQINGLPSENDLHVTATNSWVSLGPAGMRTSDQNGRYSGRILDIESDNGANVRVGAASGGLWAVTNLKPVLYTDGTSSLAISSFDSDPNNEQVVFIGTGEPRTRSGTGLWKTTNRGTSWTSVPLNPTPTGFFRVRFAPGSSSVIHAATDAGYYRSDNGGVSWTQWLNTGETTDLAINPADPNILFTAVWGTGLYRSTDGGTTWNLLTTGGIPSDNVGRTAISLCAGTPNTVYVAIAKNDSDTMLGVYKTTDGGTSWADISPPMNYIGSQGFYGNIIGVSPTNPNLVLAGGVEMIRTTDGGASWTTISEPANLHVDHHAITWGNNGMDVWVGNDGGLSYSSDAGVNWSTTDNRFPITQYVNFDIDPSTNREFAGGSQDNGVSLTTDNGATWAEVAGGDGSGVAMDVGDPNRWWITIGAYDGDWIFRRLRTTDNGANFTEIDNGIDPSQQWYHKIRTDRVSPPTLFNNSGPHIYRSVDFGDNWTKLNPDPFPVEVFNLNVSRFVTPSAVVYASLQSSDDGQRLRVYDGGSWSERSTGLPAGVRVRGVAPHPTDADKAYALMNGFSAGNKIFKTTNRGVTWTNITGDCPDVPLGDLVAHPMNDNLLYLGTEMGCYRTTNGGTNWHRWNNGMPAASIITEMKWIDSLAINGKFYVVASSYGGGLWMRDVTGDDLTGLEQLAGNTPTTFALNQNYPNPFNPSTTIRFQLPGQERVTLKVYDVAGREVARLVDQQLGAGEHAYAFDAGGLASGMYLYRLSAGSYTETRKMVLTK